MGRVSGMARNSGTMASTQARKPFMSVVPRPHRRTPSEARRNGSLAQTWPSVETTSMWPERM